MDSPATTSFPDLLRRHRLTAALTQEALAARAGLSVRAVSDLERGTHRAPRRETVRLLADALVLSGGERMTFEAAARRPATPATPRATPRGPFADLPAPLTPLIGREREVAEAVQFVRGGDVRLLTFTGAGGIGKTRLALQVAEAVAGSFADGVAFVALASLRDADLVLPTIAQAVQIRETPGQSWLETLVAALREKHLLLLLDNVEHLLAAAPAVAALLQRCPRLRVLATSRAPLRLSGEHELPVPPLAFPPRGDWPPSPHGSSRADPVAQVMRYAAGELFCQRAAAVQPAFVLTAENAAAVAEITRRLDGLPLAIELAATRMRVLTPQELLQRLDRALVVLTGGARDLPARQQTLRDTIAWSYELLTASEQALFRRLAVFAGGCTPGAAAAICDADRASDIDILDGVSSLVEQSLVRRVEGEDGGLRFTMLETIREYALEQLTASGERGETERRHAVYYLDLAEAAEPRLDRSDGPDWLARLVPEQDNLRAALRWLIERGEAEAGVRLAGALYFFWYLRGQWREGQGWLDAALAQGDRASPAARARALLGAAILRRWQSDLPGAIALAEQSVALRRALGDRAGLAEALNVLADTFPGPGDLDTAAALGAESLAIRRAAGDRLGTAWSLAVLGNIALRGGDFATARARFEEGLALWQGLEASDLDGWLLYGLGKVLGGQGEPAAARSLLERAIEYFRARGEERGIAWTLLSLGDAVARLGDAAAGRALVEESLTMLRELGERGAVAVCLLLLRALAAGPTQPVPVSLDATGEATTAAVAGALSRRGDTPDDLLATIRAELGDEALVAYWRVSLGCDMPRMDADVQAPGASSPDRQDILDL